MAHDTDKQSIALDPRVYFAAERTLLAWVRTGLAMMGFGFVVARFGLFLRELTAVKDVSPQHSSGLSLWVGTTLVILGVIVNVAAAVKHWYTVRRLERGRPLRFSPWSLGMVVAFLLCLLGLLTATYLIVGLNHQSDSRRNLHDYRRIGLCRWDGVGARVGQRLESHQALPGSTE